MARAEHSLVDAAAVVADGGTPDWTALESSADGHGRAVLARLQTLAAIARLHETLTTAGSPTVPAVRSLLSPGATWGDFQILEAVGSGRFGDVYRAFEPSLDREVALKILASRPGDQDTGLAAVEEGRLAAKIRHPNVVTIYGARRLNGQTGIWMEFVRGRTLEADLVDHGPFDAESLTRVAVQLGAALAAVHNAGLVHRDIKTSNVMRDDDGRVVLGDFGTGWASDATDDERSGLAGTPAYIAPEIFAGRPATPQSDIYGLGVLLFRLATGRLPVSARGLRGFREAHAAGASSSLAALRPDLPRRLTAAIDRAIQPNPFDRFNSAAAFSRAIRPPRRRWPVAIAAVVTACVASGLFWVAGSRGPSVPFEARDWVLVTAFDNRTGDRLLDATMAQAIEAELGTSSFVNVVPRERVNDTLLLMGRPLDTRVDANVGRQVAIRDGKIRALVEGHIERTENAYRVQARIFSPSGSTIATMTASAGDALAAAWQAAVEIRRRLGEPMPPLAARSEWPRATTSLRALNQYAMAMKLRADMKALWKDDAQREAVERVLQSAITEDPDFAMAHLALAITVGERINNRGRRDETALHARNALALAGRLPDSERLYIIGCANLFLGAAALDAAAKSTYFQQSESAFAELLRQQPDHVRALGHLASLFRLTERPDDRLRTYLQIGNLRPNAFDWRSEAARLTFSTGDHHRARLFAAEAAALLTRAELESDPTLAVWIKLFPVTDAWIQGNATLALRRLDEIARELPTAPKVGLPQFGAQVAFLYLTLGRVEQARATAQILTDEPKLRLQLEAWAVLEKEGPSELRARLAGRTTGELSMVHGLLLDAGMVNEFRQVVTLGRTERQLLVVVNDFQLGQIALIEGRMNDGLHHLQKAAGDPATGQMRPWVLRASIALADLLHRRGDRAGAIKTLERVSQVPRWQTGSVWVNGFSWVRMRAALAALYRDTGRIADAERVENELRPLLAAADPDHPVKMQLERVR